MHRFGRVIQRRKSDIARVLAENHQVLSLDESLNYMDVYFKAQLETALSEKELTLIFVEHNEEFGERIANKVLLLCEETYAHDLNRSTPRWR